MSKFRTAIDARGHRIHSFHCPGCGFSHGFDATWTITGPEDAPTVNPSLLSTTPGDGNYRCHLFIRSGKIEYLADCSHSLAGKTIDLENIYV